MTEPTPEAAPPDDQGGAITRPIAPSANLAPTPAYPPGQPYPPPGQPYPSGPPPYPAAGLPPGPAGLPPGYPFAPPQSGTDGLAIAALVLGILGFLAIPIVPAVVCGVLALRRTGRSGQGGRGLAIAGLVLSGLWTVLIVLGIVAGALSVTGTANTGSATPSTATPSSGPATPPGRTGSFAATDLLVGDCLAKADATTMLDRVELVACGQSHVGEVFAVFDLPAGPYPGAAEVDRQVEKACNDALPGYSPSALDDPKVGLFAIYPLEGNWTAGDRETVCVAKTNPPATGSLRGK